MDAPSWSVTGPYMAYAAFATTVLVVAFQFAEHVPGPYMDELFHVPQAQAYCEGKWTSWDPKITTPPGLYIPIVLAHRLLPNKVPCSTTVLRATNGLLLTTLPYLVYRILSYFRAAPYPPLRPGSKLRVRFSIPDEGLLFEAVVISSMPLAYFSGFLYYTDLASLVSVLACYDAMLHGRHWAAGLFGFVGLWMRQTNVVWVAFVAGTAAAADLAPFYGHPRIAGAGLHNPPLIDASPVDVLRSPWSLVVNGLANIRGLLPTAAPYAVVGASFVGFLAWNGGIVLGDKTNHAAAAHLPQLLYFVAFSAAFALPLVLDVRAVKSGCRRALGSLSGLARSAVLLGLSFAGVHYFTYAHPFVLSDNRHYVFYVWKRILARHWAARYALVPGYLVAGHLLWDRLARSYTLALLPTLFLGLATCLTLTPSPLIEPRYFLTPYVLLRLHFRPAPGEHHRSWARRLWCEGILYALVNAATLWVFLYRPWKAPPGMWEGEWQRFMW